MATIGIKLNDTGCGWAVTDDAFHVLNVRGKDLIGTRIYGKADLAADRRIHRSQKRQKNRRKERVEFLDSIFGDELEKMYPGFLKSVKNSGIDTSAYDYSKKYPTIYHARAAVKNGSESDLRIIYLVLLHLMQNRGNFHYTGSPADANNLIYHFGRYSKELNKIGINFSCDPGTLKQLSSVLLSNLSRKEKAADINDIYSIDKKDALSQAAIMLMLGGLVDLRRFYAEDFEGTDEKKDFCVKFADGAEWEDVRSNLTMFLSEEKLRLIDNARAVYDWMQMKKLLGRYSCFTDAYIASYETHKNDLTDLKKLCKSLKPYDKNLYSDIFFDKTNKAGYSAYIGRGYNIKNSGHFTATQEEFYDYLKKRLKKIQDMTHEYDRQINAVFARMDEMNYLCKQRSKANSVVPNILLSDELMKILDTAAETYGFLNETGISGTMTKKEEIHEIFRFTIPSWIGPLNDDKFGWAVFKEGVNPQDRIYPWELSSKIDLSKTRKNFIRKLTNDCSMIVDEKVLPDNSYYNRTMQVLNELNGITVDGEKLPVSVKQKIFNELSMQYEKVTQKNIEQFLIQEGIIEDMPHEFTGFTKKKLIHSMAPFIRARAIKPDITVDTYEKAALAVTVSSDPGLINDILNSDTDLTDEEIRLLTGAIRVSSTNPWSEYSKRALTEVKGHKLNEEADRNIIDMLMYTQATMLQLLGSEYTFIDAITHINTTSSKKQSLNQIIDGLNTPPYIKRSFHQMASVLKDIRNFANSTEFDTLCINLYVPNNIKKRHVNIRNVLLKGLTALKKKELVNMLKAEEMPLPKKKALWYAQLGQDMYTGQLIPYEEIMTDTWTIDHIYPKSKVYNEQLSNLVLTSKDENKKKGNTYPIDADIIVLRKNFWDILLRAGLMEQKKYDALFSFTPVPLEDKLASIDKLLIEHRKTAAYGAAAVIHRIFPGIRILFVGNERLSDFKNKFGLDTSDTINNLGYAKDAVYTIITGRVWDNIFTDHPKAYIQKNKDYSLNVWNYDSDLFKRESTITNLNLDQLDILYTKAQTTNRTGSFADATVYSAKHMQSVNCAVMSKGSSQKDSDVKRFGGRKSIASAYYSIVQCSIKNERKNVLVPVPTYLCKDIDKDEDVLVSYLKKKYTDPVIIRKMVPLFPTLVIDGVYYQIRSINSNGSIRFALAKPFTISRTMEFETVFKAAKLKGKRFDAYVNRYGITEETNLQLYDTFILRYEEVYAKRMNNAIDKIRSRRKEFVALDLQKQCVVLNNLFGLTASGSTSSADLTLIKESAQTGVISLSAQSLKNITLVETSATGLYDKITSF